MTTTRPPWTPHASHLLNREAPFCEKCAARGSVQLTAPCQIADDQLDTIERARRVTELPCDRACGVQPPYGFVPEAGCPVHDGEATNG